jgi:hypothetical protein
VPIAAAIAASAAASPVAAAAPNDPIDLAPLGGSAPSPRSEASYFLRAASDRLRRCAAGSGGKVRDSSCSSGSGSGSGSGSRPDAAASLAWATVHVRPADEADATSCSPSPPPHCTRFAPARLRLPPVLACIRPEPLRLCTVTAPAPTAAGACPSPAGCRQSALAVGITRRLPSIDALGFAPSIQDQRSAAVAPWDDPLAIARRATLGPRQTRVEAGERSGQAAGPPPSA